MLPKDYNFKEAEDRIYKQWEEGGAFKAGRNKSDNTFCIVIPPPNVTGSLHMGHALNNTLQDILVRYNQMQGKDVLWQPGTDHAGIATQMVVERLLDGEGKKRTDMGREAFLERVWQWKEESGGTITGQLRRLGASCDWSRERFTMDEGLSRAVLKVFVQLYKEGLIYKDKRLVNWDVKLLTAISDIEAIPTEVKGNLWHFRYPIDGTDEHIIVATTRPETMLGDTAVAVNPNDERYKHLIGKYVKLPLVGRLIPIVGDDYADPETGSGAVKITPAHDFNDFEVGKRHNLEMINILDRNGHLNENVPADYQGLERFAARKKVIADLEALELVEKIEPHIHKVPHGERSNVVIEPYLTEQWYVNAEVLAKPAIEAVEQGKTKFVPANWDKTYYEWMRNIQPWCISRQLWWGHQIPAWYAPDGTVFVEESEAAALAAAEKHFGHSVSLTRDPDVLDTWFSSGLWAFSTLGYPDETPELKKYYKTNVLVTGFDIIFFWVARMMMMGLHFMKEVPFETVYMHALVRDEKGQKMSKSKGNVIDPLDLIDRYSADALRFTLSAMAVQGRDIKLATNRVEGYRNFCTKLWNASRFAEMNGCIFDKTFDVSTVKQSVNHWVLSELSKALAATTNALDGFRFNDAANAMYHFTWQIFCDWYIELTKPILNGEDEAVKAETQKVAAFVLSKIYKALHPFMPFITQELYTHVVEDKWLIDTAWENGSSVPFNANEAAKMELVIDTISAVRSLRAEVNVPASQFIECEAVVANAADKAVFEDNKALILKLARLQNIDYVDTLSDGVVSFLIGDNKMGLKLAHIIDLSKERKRIGKDIEKTQKAAAMLEGRLSSEQFLSRASEVVIEESKEQLNDNHKRISYLQNLLVGLG